MCDDVGCLKIQLFSFLYRFLQVFINLFRQTLLHYSVTENIFSEDFVYIDLFCTHI